MSATTPDDLREVPLFATLDQHQLQVLADRMTTESYRSGQSIVREGDVGYTFFVMRSGMEDVTRGKVALRDLEPGDFFGELGILSQDGKRTATVTARSDVEVWAMFGTDFRALQTDDADVASALQRAVDERTNEQ
jgi:CRP-like cAMP-binding protein